MPINGNSDKGDVDKVTAVAVSNVGSCKGDLLPNTFSQLRYKIFFSILARRVTHIA